jgi:two-component system alkaline phosphatase synthesis response regulator PhoP
LLLRVQNALKRARYLAGSADSAEGEIIGRARVRFSKFELETEAGAQPLTHKECALLKLLFERRGNVVSRDEILNEVWSEEEFPSPRTVDNFIVRLRRLIENDAEKPEVIRSVRGIGYQLVLAEKAK